MTDCNRRWPVLRSAASPWRRTPYRALPEFWGLAFDRVFRETFTRPQLEPFEGSPPSCAADDLDLVFCADEDLVALASGFALMPDSVSFY